MFKKKTGYTPHAYIIDSRMHAAKYLLLNSNLTLKQLCDECGFTDPSTFCAVFKRKTGMSPMEFRQHGATQQQYNAPPCRGFHRVGDATPTSPLFTAKRNRTTV